MPMKRNWSRLPHKRQVDEAALGALGVELARLRGKANLSQRQLAARLGVSAAYVSQIETGATVVSLRLLRQLALIHGVMPSVLLRYLGLQEFDWLALVPEEKGAAPGPQHDPLAGISDAERDDLTSYLAYLRMVRPGRV